MIFVAQIMLLSPLHCSISIIHTQQKPPLSVVGTYQPSALPPSLFYHTKIFAPSCLYDYLILSLLVLSEDSEGDTYILSVSMPESFPILFSLGDLAPKSWTQALTNPSMHNWQQDA